MAAPERAFLLPPHTAALFAKHGDLQEGTVDEAPCLEVLDQIRKSWAERNPGATR
jgi:hypothetical protein